MSVRVLVVSGNPGLAMLLARSGYDVNDCRPMADWDSDASAVHAIVFDLGSVSATADAAARLGNAAPPVLLVGLEDSAWLSLSYELGAPLICLPLTLENLLDALKALLIESTYSSAVVGPGKVEAPPVPRRVPPAPVALRSRMDPSLPARPTPGAAPSPQAGAPTSDPDASLPSTNPPRSSPSYPAPTDTAASPRGRSAARAWAAPSRKLGPTAPSLPERNRPAPEVPPADVTDSVLTLLGRLAELTSLSEVAAVILADAVERCDAQAGALLIEDDKAWTVQASHALRPLERRLQVSPESWLIERVIVQGLGLLVQGSDIVRQRLAGLPVASWENLVAAPIGGRLGLVLLGARDRVFSEADLNKLVAIDQEAESLIARAVQLRTLARALAPYRDESE